MIGISASVLSEDLCLFVFMLASVRVRDLREKEGMLKCLCKSRTQADKCTPDTADRPPSSNTI